MTEQIDNDRPGQIEIYTTDPHEPFMRFKSTRDYFEWSTESVRQKKVLRPVVGGTTVHIFPEHITAITFMPTKESN